VLSACGFAARYDALALDLRDAPEARVFSPGEMRIIEYQHAIC
jgi:hypothetical protein